jgi:hypothetical protein
MEVLKWMLGFYPAPSLYGSTYPSVHMNKSRLSYLVILYSLNDTLLQHMDADLSMLSLLAGSIITQMPYEGRSA